MLVGPSSVPTDEPDVHSFGGIVNVPANGSDNNLGLLVSPRAIARFFREHRFDPKHYRRCGCCRRAQRWLGRPGC